LTPPNPKVNIFCDASLEIGYGHVMRSRTLASKLNSNGFEVSIFGLSEFSQNLLDKKDNNSENDAELIIYDSPINVENHLANAISNGKKTIALDWFGLTSPHINIAIHPHKEPKCLHKKFVGLDYILIREEFFPYRNSLDSKNFNKVLILMGGGDINGYGEVIANKLSLYNLDVTLIKGPLQNKNYSSDNNYGVLFNPPNIAKQFSESDWIITNGGSSFFEAQFVGKSAFVIPQTDNEETIAKIFFDRDAILGIGIDSIKEITCNQLKSISKNSKSIIDGKGADRITSIINEFL
jgi:spore coat polysaccharide biosynthesis predicted glycosyltransferase SpsG